MYIWIDHLQKVRLLNVLMLEGKGVSVLQKPDKIYLENSNLSYTLRHSPNKGSVRETFALNQLLNSGHRVTLPKSGDFQVDDIVSREILSRVQVRIVGAFQRGWIQIQPLDGCRILQRILWMSDSCKLLFYRIYDHKRDAQFYFCQAALPVQSMGIHYRSQYQSRKEFAYM